MTTTRHLVVTIAIDDRRLSLGHPTGSRLGADRITPIDPALQPRAAAVDKHLKRFVDACNRGLSRATEASRAREEGRR